MFLSVLASPLSHAHWWAERFRRKVPDAFLYYSLQGPRDVEDKRKQGSWHVGDGHEIMLSRLFKHSATARHRGCRDNRLIVEGIIS